MAARPTATPLRVRVTAAAPPVECLGPGIPVLLGAQRGREVEQVVGVTGADIALTYDVDVVDTAAGLDFGGPHVHGGKGDRFLYIVWGHRSADGDFVMFARSKLMFADASARVLIRNGFSRADTDEGTERIYRLRLPPS